MSLPVDVADAVVTALGEAGYPAVRAYKPQYSTEELATRRITVVPSAQKFARGSRSELIYDVAVDVAVQQKVDAGDRAQIDGLMNDVESIANTFRLVRLAGFTVAAWQGMENDPLFSASHLKEHGIFTSVMTLTFRVMR